MTSKLIIVASRLTRVLALNDFLVNICQIRCGNKYAELNAWPRPPATHWSRMLGAGLDSGADQREKRITREDGDRRVL